jgi:uncharacterized protein
LKPLINRPRGPAVRILQILITILVVYVGLALFVMLVQRKLIYFPARLSAEEALRTAAEEGFAPWRNASGEIIGWHFAADGRLTGSVLVVHGNAGSAVDRGYFAKPIQAAAPVDVYLLEYPGYGARSGSPSQRSFLAAAEEAFATLPQDLPIYVVAESLGTGVAAHLAQVRGDKVSGLALFVPYDDLVSVGQNQMPFLPVSWLLWDRFNPALCIKDYRGPVAVVIAEADQVIPAQFGRRLHDACAGPKRIQVVAGAGHNDVAAQTPEWWRETFAFWKQHARPELK